MELNFTPVRTSKNYNINSINIDNSLIKNANSLKNNENNTQNNQNFKNFEIIGNLANINYTPDILNENFLSNEIKNNATINCNLSVSADIDKFNSFANLCFEFDNENSDLSDIINLNIKEDVNAKIIFKYTSESYINCYHNLHLNINSENGSNTDIIFFTNLGDKSTNLISIQSNLQKNAKVNINFIDFSSKTSIFNYKSKILGENSTSNINTLYLGGEESVIDLNYLIECFSPNSNANMEVMGAISENARKHFKGTIDFKKGCKKSTGSENEFCILLSDNAKSKALPMLLCTEEDVDGKHSSSIGKVDDKELFYIMTRGLDKAEATRLIIKAKFNKLINSLFDEEMKNIILKNIDRKIK